MAYRISNDENDLFLTFPTFLTNYVTFFAYFLSCTYKLCPQLML